MNFHLILRSLGLLLLLLAAAMGLCLLAAAGFLMGGAGDGANSWEGWGLAFGVTCVSGGALLALSTRLQPRRGATVMLRKDAMAFVGIAWLMSSVHAALPYLFCQPHLPLDRAWFEAVSGLTTTGATVLADIESVPKTLLLWRSATQWLGGMGILGMFVFILSGAGASGRVVFGAESSVHNVDLTQANLRRTMGSLWLLYIVLTVVCGAGCWLFGMSGFQAVNHAMTATATAGFSTENASIGAFGAGIKMWLIVIMVISGISFPLLIMLVQQKRMNPLKSHEETWWYLAIIGGAVLAVVVLRSVTGFDENVIDIAFNIASIATTTGYTCGDYDRWPAFGKEVILVLMVIGGCAGSTAGGLKVSRLIIWVRLLRREVVKAFRPKIVMRPYLNGRALPDSAGDQLFVILTMAAFFFASGSLAMRLFEPNMSLAGCVSAVAACLLNIGPAFAEVGPTKNFADISTPSALMLPFLMLLGRLEYIAVLVLFSGKLWRSY